MKGLLPLLKKEIKEQFKTYRFLVVMSVFLIFGISQPLTLKYLPEIIKMAGEQMQINIPQPDWRFCHYTGGHGRDCQRTTARDGPNGAQQTGQPDLFCYQ
jgi:hypothetical protein